MREIKPNIYRLPVVVVLGGSSGTADDPCNPLSGVLKKVRVRAAADTTTTSLKTELYYYDKTQRANVTVYTASDAAIPDDGSWHDADADKNLDIPLSFAQHGNYTWRITPDAAPAAAMTVYIEVTIEA